MKTAKKVRVLPADVYYTLMFSALAFGGIGKGFWFDYEGGARKPVCPICYVGHVEFARRSAPETRDSAYGISIADNDKAVRAINERLGRATWERVTFKQWCRELNVVPSE